jgi:hypothetical protein
MEDRIAGHHQLRYGAGKRDRFPAEQWPSVTGAFQIIGLLRDDIAGITTTVARRTGPEGR